MLRAIYDEVRDVKTKMGVVEVQNTRLEVQNTRLEVQNTRLEGELRDVKGELRDTRGELRDVKTKMEVVEAQNNDLKRRFEEKDAEDQNKKQCIQYPYLLLKTRLTRRPTGIRAAIY
jgi:chromosome segregation ATPase